MSETDPDAMALVDTALRRVGSDVGAVECQGMLAGWLCACGSLTRDVWLKQLVAVERQDDVAVQEACDTLDALRKAMVVQLNDPLLEFKPLLPDDATPLAGRVEALGEWCQGFLMGMALGGIKDLAKLPGDSGEAVRDLVQLARAGSYDLGDDEEDERAYADLVEYVRTAVLLVNEDINPSKAPPQMDPTIH